MIRMIQRRLIIPRGDTGSFSIPYLKAINPGDVAVFTIFDIRTKTKMYQKLIAAEGDILNIAFTHGDTVNLKPGKYLWDIKFYTNPQIIDDELVNGDEVDSYYAGFSLPECEIRETGDTLLTSDDAPTSTISPESLNIINAAINEILNTKRAAVEAAETAGLKADAAAESAENASDFAAAASQSAATAEARVNEIESLSVEVNTGLEGTNASVTYTPSTGVLSFIIPRGNTGNGIASCVLNDDFTLTINYTNGDSTTTIPIRGDTPHLTIGEVTEGPHAIATITGTDANPILNLTLPNANVPTKLSQLTDDIGVAGKANSADLATVATSGSYTDLGDKPHIPAKTSDLTNDSNYAVDSNYVHTDNNYTTAEKNKLSGIAAGAEVNVNADWNAASGDAYILNKPTKVSQFTNDAGYLTTETDPTVPAWAKAAQKPSYTAAEVGAPTVQEMNTAIGNAIGNINSFDMAVVQTLPTQDISTHTIYLVPKTGETNDVYDEYIYINDAWEMVGNTQIDLSNYVQKTDYATADNAGIVKIGLNSGLVAVADGSIVVSGSVDSTIKSGVNARNPITPKYQHTSTFYGLAKAAGDTTQSQSDNAVGTYTDEAKAAIQQMLDVPAKADIPEVPVQDIQVNGTSILENGVANVPVGSNNTFGVYKTGGYGVTVSVMSGSEGTLGIASASNSEIKTGSGAFKPITASNQYRAAFYGLAKAAGDTTQSQSDNAVGQYTDEAKAAIRNMIGAPALEDIPDVPVQDVQINGASILSNGMANVPRASNTVFGVVRTGNAFSYSGDTLVLSLATESDIKGGANNIKATSPNRQHLTAFYGLAKAAGADMKDIANTTVGTYPDAQKEAIQSMLGITQMLAPENPNLVASQAYSIGDVFAANGHLYKATAAIAQDEAIIPDTNCVETTMVDAGGKIKDVQVNGTSVVGSDGVANVPKASTNILGAIMVGSGLSIGTTGVLRTDRGTVNDRKLGTNFYIPVVMATQHESTFYGLSKVAGVDLANETVTLGTYPETSKTAIKAMLGVQDGLKVVRLI